MLEQGVFVARGRVGTSPEALAHTDPTYPAPRWTGALTWAAGTVAVLGTLLVAYLDRGLEIGQLVALMGVALALVSAARSGDQHGRGYRHGLWVARAFRSHQRLHRRAARRAP